VKAFRIATIGALALCAGCERMPSDMSRQPRYNAADASPFFADTQATRPPVDGTVVHSHGDIAMVSSGRSGTSASQAQAGVGASTGAQITRGRERYTIYCQPCHGDRGQGDGEVVRRGFPPPPAFTNAAVRAVSDDQIRHAIVHGIGVMYPFGDRVGANDATAIVAYVRVLQAQASASPASEAAR
jgi:mono/diheme cytochrome c family protein